MVHHEVADAHCPLPEVALPVQVTIPTILDSFAWLEADLLTHVQCIAMPRSFRQCPIHVVCEEVMQLAIHAICVFATNLNQTTIPVLVREKGGTEEKV